MSKNASALKTSSPPKKATRMATLPPECLGWVQDAVDVALRQPRKAAAAARLADLQRKLHALTGEPMPPTREQPKPLEVPAAASTDLFDALTLALERADALATHLAERLSALDEDDDGNELYALSLIAQEIRDKHALILEKARALHRGAAESGGVR